MTKKALITGITGQDGAYLAALLISKGYEVHGINRRTSLPNTFRIEDLLDKITLHYGDLTDSVALNNIVQSVKPDEIYNLGAQSHVKVSFENPIYTADCVGLGTLRMLEAARILQEKSGKTVKFYQASSSEQFGKVFETPQKESTPFYPRSPYACAKTYAHYQCVNYREAYDMFVSSGILFNHETVTYGTPVIIKIGGKIDILPIGDVARFKSGLIFNMDGDYQEGKPITNIEIWDKNGWTNVKYISGYPHKEQKNPRIINARNFVYSATGSHVCFMEDGIEKKTEEINIGDKTLKIKYPEINNTEEISLEQAEFLGMMVADGNLKRNTPRFTKTDQNLKDKFMNLWSSFMPEPTYYNHKTYSGFNGKEVGQVSCYSTEKGFDFDVYTNDISPFGHKNKKVPSCILNGSLDVMEAFLIGYNNCDGLKKNRCKYKFKNFTTNSPTLAAGLLFLVSHVTKQKYNITVEESWKWGKKQFYYSINLLSNQNDSIFKYEKVQRLLEKNISLREISRQTSISRNFISKVKNGYVPTNTHHLEKCDNEVKKIINIPDYNGWFFDLETESGTFHGGIGNGLLHNSPKRGETFVTRKITKAIPMILAGRQDKLFLGNLDARRDWGYSGDYVKAMWMMLQHNKPDDYVISTGQTHSVREFCDIAFSKVGLDYQKYVKVDPKFFRPTEVDLLIGDSSKARETLGWHPTISFAQLVEMMVIADVEEYEEKNSIFLNCFGEEADVYFDSSSRL